MIYNALDNHNFCKKQKLKNYYYRCYTTDQLFYSLYTFKFWQKLLKANFYRKPESRIPDKFAEKSIRQSTPNHRFGNHSSHYYTLTLLHTASYIHGQFGAASPRATVFVRISTRAYTHSMQPRATMYRHHKFRARVYIYAALPALYSSRLFARIALSAGSRFHTPRRGGRYCAKRGPKLFCLQWRGRERVYILRTKLKSIARAWIASRSFVVVLDSVGSFMYLLSRANCYWERGKSGTLTFAPIVVRTDAEESLAFMRVRAYVSACAFCKSLCARTTRQ